MTRHIDRSTTQRRDQGFALAAALLAVLVVGAIVTGGFYAASLEGRVGTTTGYGNEALYIAEQGVENTMGTYSKATLETIAVGSNITTSGSVTVGSRTLGTYAVTIRRLATAVYYIESTGTVTRGGRYSGATRTVAAITRTLSLNIKTDRAMQIYGGLNVGGNSKVSGDDAYPSAWDGTSCPDSGIAAGVVAKDTTQVYTSGSGTIVGDPAEQQDTTLADSSFTKFGDLDYDALAAMADKKLPAGSNISDLDHTHTGSSHTSSACRTSDLYNWGDPLGKTDTCHTYWPIIHAAGNLSISGNDEGQGILLVDGDFSMTGSFQFFGFVVVKGTMNTGSGGARIFGSTLVYGQGVLGDTTTISGTPIISLSSCSIKRAQTYNSKVARPVKLTTRSWIDLSAAGVN